MANDKETAIINTSDSGGNVPVGGSDRAEFANPGPARGKPAGSKLPPPPAPGDPILEPAKRGRKPTNFGQSAELRREANQRHLARKAAAAAGQTLPEATTVRQNRTASVPGYSKRLVKAHKQAALLLDVPELSIDADEARDLEESVIAYMSMKGFVIKGDSAVTFDLVWCIVTIYGPIFIALWRKFVMTPDVPATIQGNQSAPQAMPTARVYESAPPAAPQPMAQPQAMQQGETRSIITGFPETEALIMPDGSALHGMLFKTPNIPTL